MLDAALDADPDYRPDPAELREVLREVEGELSDEGGLVEPETLERFGLTAVRARTRIRTLLHRPASAAEGDAAEEPGVAGRMAPRTLAGLAAGVLVLAGLEGLGPQPPFSVAAVSAVAAVLVACLPRVGWVLSALFVCGWLGTPEADSPGTALVLAAALAPTPLLLPRAGLLWSVPALAPLLGAVALAPAVRGGGRAGLHGVAPRRPGGGGLHLAGGGRGDHRRRPAVRRGRRHAGARALGGLAGGRRERRPLPAGLLARPGPDRGVGGLRRGAAVLRARPLGGDGPARRRSAWAAGLVLAHGVLGDMLAATTELDRARGAVAGAALGGLVAVTVTLIAPPVTRRRSPAARRGATAPRITLSSPR